MFDKVLIANRGEIAVRLIRACHEMRIATVAVYSDVDADALHVRLADESVLLGPASPNESYLRAEKIIEAALQTGAQAIHPGYGFLSEAPDFAEAVRDAGLSFIGPPTEAIRAMGVKTEARAIMDDAGVPVVPGFQSADADEAEFLQAAAEIGYPVMIKAAGGGGGKGIRVVHDPADLPDALQAARREAVNAFGDPTLFLERFIESGHHIEIQILADHHGNVVHLFERECSIQRRHQKIVEETPSPLVTPEMRTQMGQAAVEAAKAVGYTNAGTVEFIADADGSFYFLEMNTRLQVEHPITEMVTGIDLVQWQLRIAAGEQLTFVQDDVTQRGHAIECRLYAEDPENGFLPATGTLLRIISPQGPGIRWDGGVVTGDDVTVYYDPLISKIIVYAEGREAAIQRMAQGLSETVVLGVTNNLGFLHDVITHPAFIAGDTTTDFVDAYLTPWNSSAEELPPEGLIAAALGEMLQRPAAMTRADVGNDADRFSPWARPDRFRIGGVGD